MREEITALVQALKAFRFCLLGRFANALFVVGFALYDLEAWTPAGVFRRLIRRAAAWFCSRGVAVDRLIGVRT